MATNGYYCEKCHRTMSEKEFYGSNNLTKYPNDGKLNRCKKCITMHVDNWNPETYLWILQECDVPWIPDEWNRLLENYGRDPSKLTGLTILGRYLSKMKLKQYKEYRWKDTEFLQQLADNKMEQAMKRQGYEAAEIATAIQEARSALPDPDTDLREPDYPDQPTQSDEDYFARTAREVEADLGLTEEDISYLSIKWGNSYKQSEWVQLEKLYQEMMESYDIQGAGHKDTLKLICKTSLKANQLIDYGDVEGFQKMSKVYDSLMKSGKFTAAQNKAESGEFVDSISELVALCEKEGFIPRYYIDEPKDRVDAVLADTKDYVRSLVTEEMNLGNLIENALKTMAREEEKEEDEEIVEDDLTTLEEVTELTDQDFIDQQIFLEEDQALDQAGEF